MRIWLILFVSLWAPSLVMRLTSAADPLDDLRFQLADVFQLEFASDPQISPDGSQVVYVRNSMDIMHDRRRSNLWMVNADGSEHRPLTSGNRNDSSPRWSPSGDRIVYVASVDETAQLFCRWMQTGETAQLTRLTSTPTSLTWSPDERWIAFSMLVPNEPEPFVRLPAKPDGAQWAEPAKVIRSLVYRADGQGYVKQGHHHLFLLPSEGGTPRQLTRGDFNHQGPLSWTPESGTLLFSANRNTDWEYLPFGTEVFQVTVDTRRITQLTRRDGPDTDPVVSPDGTQIAYVGFDDQRLSYQVARLYVMDRNGNNPRLLTGALDRAVQTPRWHPNGKGLFFQFDDLGETKIGHVSLDGALQTVASDVGGVTIGRPYASGSFSLSERGQVAYTVGTPERPADVALGQSPPAMRRLTDLNHDLLGHKAMAQVQEFWCRSSFDNRKIHGWIVLPPEFDAQKKYPLILEIHGGPFANYGPRFSAEIQLFATAGYVVLYANPRGSTSYGQDFAHLIHHDYPGHDFEDLMSSVDAVIDRGFVDPDQLYVTGGSGGGVLTSWIVGKTDRFRAAVSAKPVTNWYSFMLTTDMSPLFSQYWFPGPPWEHPQHYRRRSPLSLVGNVRTPTMLLTGEVDYRTPISESEQFYQALKLRKIDTALVRIPNASHGIVARPSNLISKVAHILKWFELHKETP